MTEKEISNIKDNVTREIMYKHIIENKTFNQIAKEVYFSRSTVRRKYRAVIKEYMNNKTV